MNRNVVLALSALMILGACSDKKTTSTAAAPELLPAQPAPPTAQPSPVTLPPLPSVTAGDAAAAPAPGRPTGTAIDSPATNPKGALTKEEEVKGMPEAGHGNNHSSPSLESSPQK